MVGKSYVYFQWQASSFFGWGIYGLNLMLHTALRPDVTAVSSCGVDEAQIAISPLERLVIHESIQNSNQIAANFRELGAGTMRVRHPVLHAIGSDFTVGNTSAGGVKLESDHSVAVIFFEDSRLTRSGLARAASYTQTITGSTWNREILEAHGFRNVTTILQGVDATNFHPAPKSGLLHDRFVVFSGGKLEYRKGQDLVVQAFAIFAARHPDALLVTAWSSPFPKFAPTVNQNPGVAPLELVDGQFDAMAWTRANGIPDSQAVHLGPVPNAAMPRILREADVGLFPNRAEGGTNLVAMEAMACGVPCMLSMNTGHLDLVGDGAHCLPLGQQHRVDGEGCDGWGRSDVEEMVAVLEAVYTQRDAAAELGRRGAAFMRRLSWSRQIDQLIGVIGGSGAQRAAAA